MGLRSKTPRPSDPGGLDGKYVAAVSDIDPFPLDGAPVPRGALGRVTDYDAAEGLYHVDFGAHGPVLAERREIRPATDGEVARSRVRETRPEAPPLSDPEPSPLSEPLFIGAATDLPDDPEDQRTTPGVSWRFDELGREVA